MTQYRTAGAISEPLQTRDSDGNAPMITGYFAVFGSPYEICPGVREFVDAHAFDETLSGDIRALINHDTTLVLGRTSANTLQLHADSYGLAGTITINRDDTDAMNMYARVKRGDVSQCSFGFEITRERTQHYDNGDMDFIIERVTLHEVSVCTFPAYEKTSVSARTAFDARQEQIQRFRAERIQRQKDALREMLRNAKK